MPATSGPNIWPSDLEERKTPRSSAVLSLGEWVTTKVEAPFIKAPKAIPNEK